MLTTTLPTALSSTVQGAPYIAGDKILVNGETAYVAERFTSGSGMTKFVITYVTLSGRQGWAYVTEDGLGFLAGAKVTPHPDPED